jgi:hypothetical protein
MGHMCKIDSDTIVMPHTGAAALRAAGTVSIMRDKKVGYHVL